MAPGQPVLLHSCPVDGSTVSHKTIENITLCFAEEYFPNEVEVTLQGIPLKIICPEHYTSSYFEVVAKLPGQLGTKYAKLPVGDYEVGWRVREYGGPLGWNTFRFTAN
jgi:hypothetical protein